MNGPSDGMAALIAGVMLAALFVVGCVLLGFGAAVVTHVFTALT